jgi:hypothetical protein
MIDQVITAYFIPDNAERQLEFHTAFLQRMTVNQKRQILDQLFTGYDENSDFHKAQMIRNKLAHLVQEYHADENGEIDYKLISPDHRDGVRTVGGKELLLARGGQVINLALGGNEPPEYIQVTRGLVWLATLKGASIIGQKPGRYRLEDRAVKGFVNDVQRDLRAAGLGSLQNPTF